MLTLSDSNKVLDNCSARFAGERRLQTQENTLGIDPSGPPKGCGSSVPFIDVNKKTGTDWTTSTTRPKKYIFFLGKCIYAHTY